MSIAAESLMCYLVEWYRPGLDEDKLNDIVGVLERSSASVTDEGSPVRCVLTLAVPTDEVVFGVFTADSAAAVVSVCRRAGMPASRLTAALADRACAQ